MEDRQPLLGATEETVRKRNVSEKKKHWSENIPEYARVYLARRKKSDPIHIKAIEVFLNSVTLLLTDICCILLMTT